jgi:hypothetical protein
MPRVDAQSAVFHLQRGALGIGEYHTSGEGRQLVLALIELGVVNHLFLELAYTIYPRLISRAQKIYDDAREHSNVVAKMQEPLGIPERRFLLHPYDQTMRVKRIPIKEVIAKAITKHVKVHCADHPCGESPGPQEYSNFKQRHSTLRRVFKQAIKTTNNTNAISAHTKGCLILFGLKHFTSEKDSIENFILRLPYVATGEPFVRLGPTELGSGKMKIGRLGPPEIARADMPPRGAQ